MLRKTKEKLAMCKCQQVLTRIRDLHKAELSESAPLLKPSFSFDLPEYPRYFMFHLFLFGISIGHFGRLQGPVSYHSFSEQVLPFRVDISR
jgi:hypothetical protein